MNRSLTPMRLCLYAVYCILLFPILMHASDEDAEFLVCSGHVNVSLGSSCDLNISVAALIEGNVDPTGMTYSIQTMTGQDVPTDDLSDYLNKDLKFVVTDLAGLSCWGLITLEDKLDPIIDCTSCTDPNVTDPDCIFNCAEYELFKKRDPTTASSVLRPELLDQILPSDPELFITNSVTDNCDDSMIATYVDAFIDGNCGSFSKIKRTWTVSFMDSRKGRQELTCDKYYAFQPFQFLNMAGVPELPEGNCQPMDGNNLFMPPKSVVIPDCIGGTSPEAIASYFDDPETFDNDSDANGIDPIDGDVDYVIENNEGICYAYPHFYVAGYDTLLPIEKHAQPLVKDKCGLTVLYSDILLESCQPGCTGNAKFSRQWTVFDWCSNEILEYQQVIRIEDNTPPTIEVSDILGSVDPWQCKGTIYIPQPEHIKDDCDNGPFSYTVQLLDRFNELTGNEIDGYVLHNVPIGDHELLYIVEDCCGNKNRTTVNLIVKDKTPPVPVTKETLVVDLVPTGFAGDPTQGVAKIHAYDMDNGSYDSCTDVELYVRRFGPCNLVDTLWNDHVRFCCDDIGTKEFVLIDVEFKVEDAYGNANYSWGTIRLENKSASLICPPDLVIACDVDYNNFDNTGGVPTGYTACAALPILVDTLEVIEDTEPRRKSRTQGFVPGYIGVAVPAYSPACGFGAIRRKFDQCTQWIVVETSEALELDTSTIVFPTDTIITCMDADTGEPYWRPHTCNLVGYTVESDTFYIESDACVSILNKWSVINWCHHNPEDPDFDNIVDQLDPDQDGEPNLTDTDDDGDGILDNTYYTAANGDLRYEPDLFDPAIEDSGEVEGYWSHTQVIKMFDDEKPTILSTHRTEFHVDTDCHSKEVLLSAVADDAGDCPSPWLGWTVTIDLYNDWDIEQVYTYNTLRIINGEPNPLYIEKTARGQELTILLPDGTYASDVQHRVEWLVTDGCGNQTVHTSYFTIEDGRAPTPYCAAVSTAVMSNGEVELWAKDFDQGSFDDCDQTVTFTFTATPPPPRCDDEYSRYTGTDPGDWYDGTFWFYDSIEIEDDPTDNDCELVGYGAYEDQDSYGGHIHRWDAATGTSGAIFTAGQMDPSGYINIPVYAWDKALNSDFCLVNLRIIDNGGGATIGGAIRTENAAVVQEAQIQINAEMPDYPKYATTDINGDYAFQDNVMAEEYTLTGKIEGDYLNGVSTVDLVRIQRHILGIEQLNSPYKMIAADVNGDLRINGVDLVELRKLILGIYQELPQNDSWKFIDASQSLLVTDPWIYREYRILSEIEADLMEEDFIGVKIGDVDNSVELVDNQIAAQKVQSMTFDDRSFENGEEVEIKLNSESEIYGFQFTLDMTDMTLIDISGQMIEEGSVFRNGNSVTISCHSLTPQSGDLLTIKAKATAAGYVSNSLDFNSRITPAELYTGADLETHTLHVDHVSEYTFSVAQNVPNPFDEATKVSYVLPAEMPATVTINDITGKQLYRKTVDGKRGENVIILTNSNLTTGILYYKIEAGGHAITRKMVVVK